MCGGGGGGGDVVEIEDGDSRSLVYLLLYLLTLVGVSAFSEILVPSV